MEAGEMVFVPSREDDAVQPEAAATGEAPIFYVYGVVPSEQELPADLLPSTGLDEAFAPYIVRHGAMNVILSKLSARTFSTESVAGESQGQELEKRVQKPPLPRS